MGVYNTQQIIDLINTANPNPDILWDVSNATPHMNEYTEQLYNEMWYQYENAPTVYRELYVDKNLAYWESQGVPRSAFATEQMVPQAVVENGVVKGTTAQKMPATTTPVGNVKAGALAGRIPLGTLIAGTAIGAGVGLKEVATHPKFWNDLSDAVFNDLKNPDTYIAKPLAETETANIIWRCLEDGSIQGYCDKRDVDTVIRNLYQMDAFNVIDRIDPTVTHSGDVECNPGPMDVGFITDAVYDAGFACDTNIIYSYLQNVFPTCNTIEARASYNPDTGYGNIIVYCYNVPNGVKRVYENQGRLSVNTDNAWKLGNVAATTHFGEFESLTHTPGSTAATIGIGVTSSGYSNLGAVFTPKNPNVIYNGTDQLPPENPDDFWQTFATWLANAFNITAYNPLTNANETVTYLPFTAPDKNWQVEDITGNQQNVWQGLYDFVAPFTTPSPLAVNNPSPWIFESIGNFFKTNTDTPQPTPWDNNPKFPQPTPTPVGSTPTIAVPTSGVSSGNKLYTVYNPTQSEVDNLGAYLWTQNIVELIAQFFQNPLDAIISLHMIYCTPSTGSPKNIMLGYLNSNVSAAVVTSQYEDVPCGYVDIPEYYGNALDYTGVAVQVFLPFIGYRVLKTKEVMGRRLEINYKVDVYTGTCLAFLYVISANTRQLLYTFEGNCSVQIPLTAADRTRLIAGITTAGLSAFTGNPAGVVGGIASIGANIERSGSFSGNAGAMNVKKPFVVITRAINAQASHYNTLYGYPLNKYGYLRNFRGYTRVQSVHVDIPGATDREKAMIESALKSGIKI